MEVWVIAEAISIGKTTCYMFHIHYRTFIRKRNKCDTFMHICDAIFFGTPREKKMVAQKGEQYNSSRYN